MKSYATVNVVADDGSNLGNAIVYGKWSGLGSSIFLKATTNNQGIASFNGPELRNNLSGDEIFTVYAVRFPWSAYNPDENVIENPLWYWPYYRANGSYSMPLP